MSSRVGNTHDVFCRLLRLVLCFTFQFSIRDKVLSVYITSPSRGDFATCKLTMEEKEKFLIEHNKFRGMVNPPAADMEYLTWDDNLANLAQMWANKCIWAHGFVKFGDQYPYPVNFTEEIGQNLAREVDKLENPESRVERWYLEYKQYTYSKFQSPMSTAVCSKGVCGHYTQLAWAKSKYVGCAVAFCANFFQSYGRGGTMVACDYGPTGNIIGQYPYKTGTPCTKCASGKGFCYKNLCRECADFDEHCGKTSFPKSKCSSHPDLMERVCPKMCNLCKCPLKCLNGGTVNLQECVCVCPSGWRGMDCSAEECPPGYYGENCENRCYDRVGKETCEWRVANGHDCKAAYMEYDCAATCGYCDDGSKITTPPPAATVVPTASSVTSVPIVSLPATTKPVVVSYPTPAAPQVLLPACTTDLDSSCEGWAAVGECEKNPLWMIPNCCLSCKHHNAPEDCIDSSEKCPLWAFNGECEQNRVWMTKNCRKSCIVCGDCKDTDAKCPSWALLDECSSGSRTTWMNKNCRKSCGLCKVYDRHNDCPAWSAMDECKKSNWTWMVDNCPRSCDVPFSETSFCGGKTSGNYQAPTTCLGYIACSNGVTSHVACPAGKKFDTVKRICETADRAICKVNIPSNTSQWWKMIATL